MREAMRHLPMLCALALLAACQSVPVRGPSVQPDPAVSGTSDAAVPLTAVETPGQRPPGPDDDALPRAASVDIAAAAEVGEPDDVWQRLREGFMLPGCDYAPGTERWARRYAASPMRFAATLERMLPAIDYTQRRMQQAQLPGEFALLPIVESHYHPYPGPSSRPAGMWQMIGPTARSAGVRIDPWFDGRLNLIDSTDAAVTLFDRYGDYFNSDWRLVAFAYNSGEYRIRKALDRHQPGDDFDSLLGLRIARTSYEYLTKLLALSCLIREPERFDLQLPALADHRELQEIELDGVIGVSLARALSGLSDDDFSRVNGGLLKGRTPPGDDHRLLVAADRAQLSSDVFADIPTARRMDWQQRRLLRSESLDDVADRSGVLLETLLAINDVSPPGAIAPGTSLWLPGRASAAAQPGPQDALATGVHVVRSGDSLWTVARRYGLTVAQLLRYNQMDNERLMPGQRLRLTAP